LSSRIALINYSAGNDSFHLLGLLAERIMETLTLKKQDVLPTGVKLEDAPYLCEVANTERGLVQLIDLERLLPESVRSQLFPPSPAAA
jgi:chemotaxis-related protein WspB